MLFSGAGEKMIHGKSLKQKILCYCPFHGDICIPLFFLWYSGIPDINIGSSPGHDPPNASARGHPRAVELRLRSSWGEGWGMRDEGPLADPQLDQHLLKGRSSCPQYGGALRRGIFHRTDFIWKYSGPVSCVKDARKYEEWFFAIYLYMKPNSLSSFPNLSHRKSGTATKRSIT